MPLPRNPPWPRLPPALLLAAFALAPAARAADGFTEIGIDAPDPVPYAARPSLLADDDPLPPAADDDAEWAAWWREWRGWTPFATPDPDSAPRRDDDSARLGGATIPQPTGLPFAFADAAPLFIATTSARGTGTISTPTTTTTSGPATEEEETITRIEVAAPTLLADPPPAPPAAPVIGEPASMALLGGALAALGLLRRRRPAVRAG